MTGPAIAPWVAGAALVAAVWLLGRSAPPTSRRSAATATGAVLAIAVAAAPELSRAWIPALLGLSGTGWAGWLLWRAGRRRAAAERRRARVLEACGLLGAELAAGQPATVALTRTAAEWAELAPAAEAASLGADVAAALRLASRSPGAGDLALVAAAWQVAHRTGGGLAAALHAVVDDLRAGQETRRVVASELASARATARLVAALPLAVLATGGGAGGDPVGFLLHEPLGWTCGAAGLLLLFAGLSWIEAIARAADLDG